MMKWLIGLVGILVAIIGGVSLGKTTAPQTAAFNYDEASIEDKQVWLEAEGAKIERGIKAGLSRNGSSYMYIAYRETAVSARRDEVKAIVRQKMSGNVSIPPNYRQSVMDQMCPTYVKSALYTNKIKLTFVTERKNGSVLAAQSVGASACDRHLQIATS